MKKLKTGGSSSLWISTTERTNYPAPKKITEVDVAIIGGGIAGLSVAYELLNSGKKIAVVEMNRIAEGVTGFTTAKITALHGFKYQKIIKGSGVETARLYAEGNELAIKRIEEIIKKESIDCDFSKSEAYSFTEEQKGLRQVKAEVEAAKKAGLKVTFEEETSLPFEIKGAVKLKDQAQFHPRKYLLRLAKIVAKKNYIFENTRMLDIKEEGDFCRIITNQKDIIAKKVVLATNFPAYDTGNYYAKLFPYYSYAMAFKIKGEVPRGMYLTYDEPHHSIRSHISKEGEYLIVGGGHHKTGQGGNTSDHYDQIEYYARERFEVVSVEHYWSTMDYKTSDEMPYIGKAPKSKNIYLATGYGAWGMANGVLSGMILSDLIINKKNKYAKIFDPSRRAKTSKVIGENANVSEQLLGGLLRKKILKPEDLKDGEGKVFSIKKENVAVSRDSKGNLNILSPKCTHMGCQVNWNNAEETWDCPCHGSRFSKTGKVIHGPAKYDLEKKKNK